MPVKPIPDAYHTVTPYIIVDNAAAAIDFYKRAFGAVETMRLPMPDGKVAHAEIKIGDSHIMLADEAPAHGVKSPKTVGGTSLTLMIYVADVDTVFTRALEAGGILLRPLRNQFYGDRSGCLTDPFGHQWTIATHIEDVSPEEIDRRLSGVSTPPENA